MRALDPQLRRREILDSLGILIMVLLCAGYVFPRWADWNQNSRFDLTRAIVDEGTLSIDCCVTNTGDYALFEGHTYSDKAPGLSFLAVPVYATWKLVAGGLGLHEAATRMAQGTAMHGTLRAAGSGLRDDKVWVATAMIVATFFSVALPSALASVALFVFLGAISAQRGYRIAVALVYALATMAFSYSNAFYAHQLVAAALLIAFVLLFSLNQSQRPVLRSIGVGSLLGLALISEYPAVLIVVPLLAYAAHQSQRTSLPSASTMASIAIGMLPLLLLAAAYHYAIFHTPLPVAYRYSALWQERHSVGFISITSPQLDALWGITFSPYRGLFFAAPVLLLSPWGLWLLWQRRTRRPEVVVSVVAITAFLAFNSASSMWWGGFAIGPRYLLPMLPFLSWPLIAYLDEYGDTRNGRLLFLAAVGAAWFVTWSMTLAGQHFPEDTHRVPLIDYALPELARGNIARNVGTVLGLSGWWSLLPLVGAAAAVGSTWWTLTRR